MIYIRRSPTLHFLGLLLTIFLVACESSADDELSSYIYEVKSRKARPIEPIPDFLPLPKFTYPEADNRRSPFKQKAVTTSEQSAPNQNRPKQPLEKFPLDALKFVGIIKQGSTIWGLISKPDGEIARVRPGNYMGQNFGRIISITNTSLILEETLKVSDKWEKKRIIFNLKASE